MPHLRTFNLALLGLGNVGRALVRLLVSRRDQLRDVHGIEWRITAVATRSLGWIVVREGIAPDRVLDGSLRRGPVMDVHEWLQTGRADMLFETTSLNAHSGQPAIEHLRAALQLGIHAITANKGPVIHAFEELQALAAERGKRFLFESAVMDGVPIFSLFRECLPLLNLCGFRGVLNSTTNVVLEEMEQGRSVEHAVRRAQELGVAESDPADDLDGWDAAVKTAALARVLMGARLDLQAISRRGITHLTAGEVQAARAAGTPIKLVCRARREGDKLDASVAPEKLGPDDPLALVHGTSSAVYFESDIFPGLGIVEENPGLDATAYGLLADFITAVGASR